MMNPDASSIKMLTRLGGWMAIIQAVVVSFAVVGYFIWPHVFSDHDARMVLTGIQESPWVYFMRLDPMVLFGTLLQLPVYLGLWAALHSVHAGRALLALTVGGFSTLSVLPTRPLRELYYLSDLFSEATGKDQQQIYLSATETLMAQFHGTAWAISIMLGGLAGILFAFLMHKSTFFRKITTQALFLSGLGAVVVLIPYIGIIALFTLGTLVGILASILYGLDLLAYSREMQPPQRMVPKSNKP